MDAPAACEIERLPEDLLMHVISLTSPADAFPATAGSRASHAAADSDTVWFSQAADIGHVNILEICAKIQRNMLSQNTTYVAYMVFKLGPRFYSFDFPFQEASFGIAGSQSTRQVCLQGYVEDGDGADVPPRKHIVPSSYHIYNHDSVPPQKNVVFPHKKADGWMEVELGEFHNEGGDGEVSISLTETTKPKSGLIVWGIVIRSKQQKKKQKEEVSNKGQKYKAPQDQCVAAYWIRTLVSPEDDKGAVQMVARALAAGDRARLIVLDEDDEDKTAGATVMEEKKMATPLATGEKNRPSYTYSTTPANHLKSFMVPYEKQHVKWCCAQT
uniref:F-box domain-containing protein n=1 Tax=Aegilops tauschii TaxID=37682 RepID=M8C279_AEGTA